MGEGGRRKGKQVLRSRQIGRTTVRLTELGFGGSVIGNLYRAVEDETARAAVLAAMHGGVRYFDTAPHYGIGLSESRLGEALSKLTPRDNNVVVSTKVGRLLEPRVPPLPRDDEGFDVPGTVARRRDYSRAGVLRSLDASLDRLGRDHVDIVYVHDPDDHWEQAAYEAVPALVELRDQGVIGAVGVGMNQSAMLSRFLRETDVDVVMLAGRYTLLEQGALDDVLPAAVATGKSVVAVGVFNSGLLARDAVPQGAHYDYAEAPPILVDRARRLAAVCADHGTTLPAAAMAFPLRHPAVVNVTVGMLSPEQVQRNLTLHATAVPDELWDDLRQQRLLRR
jgi:D-threo-aldose 1-dehydrogenase